MKKFLLYYPKHGSRFSSLFPVSKGTDSGKIYEFEVVFNPEATIMVGTVLEVPIPETEKVAVLWVGKKEHRGGFISDDHCQVDILGIGNKENGDIDQSGGELFHSFIMQHWTKKELPTIGK